MEGTVQRRILIGQIRGLEEALHQKGVPFGETFSDEDLSKMPEADLMGILRQRRDLARTPIS